LNKKINKIRFYNQSSNWSEIRSWYAQLTERDPGFEPLLDLVNHIIDSGMSKRLFAYTSVHKLVVGIYEKIEYNSEALHIEFDIDNSKWNFNFHSKPFEPIEFQRTYNVELGIDKFDQIVKYLNW